MTWGQILALVFAAIGLLTASVAAIRYRITPTHLEITWLLFTLRRVRLDDVRYVSTKRSLWSEKWYNTWRVRNRRLTLHRRNGLVKTVTISPKNPFVFKAELDRAMGRTTQPSDVTCLPQSYPTAATAAFHLQEKHSQSAQRSTVIA